MRGRSSEILLLVFLEYDARKKKKKEKEKETWQFLFWTWSLAFMAGTCLVGLVVARFNLNDNKKLAVMMYQLWLFICLTDV